MSVSVRQIAPECEVTVKSLLVAYENESNAHTKYIAYAAQADSDGLHEVASLFRATTRSE